MRRPGLLAAVIALSPLSAPAQSPGWSLLPGDESPAYTASYMTSGSFYCNGAGVFGPGTACSAFGSALRLSNGGAFLDITFTGLTQTITAAAYHRDPVGSLGVFTATTGGTGAFRFPVPLNSNVAAFGFTLQLQQTGPVGAAGVHRIGYILPPIPTAVAVFNCCEDTSDYIALPTTRAAYPFAYPSVVFNGFSNPTFGTGSGTYNLTAAVGIVPEPSTLALSAIGGLAVGLVARRRWATT